MPMASDFFSAFGAFASASSLSSITDQPPTHDVPLLTTGQFVDAPPVRAPPKVQAVASVTYALAPAPAEAAAGREATVVGLVTMADAALI